MKKIKIKTHPPETEKLKEKLRLAEEGWKRALADYQNLEKRIEKQRSDNIAQANRSLIDKLLNIIDDLDTAAQHLNNEGLNLIVNNFKTLLASEGLQEIIVEGKEFDPLTMECIEKHEGKSNIVVGVQKKGYRLHDQIIRPAKVMVGK
jgi:molecular chaperone GrpE